MMCGRFAEYESSETGNGVCSIECKHAELNSPPGPPRGGHGDPNGGLNGSNGVAVARDMPSVFRTWASILTAFLGGSCAVRCGVPCAPRCAPFATPKC